MNNYQKYLLALNAPFKRIAKLEFLQPDGSVAFFLDNKHKTGYNSKYNSRAFIQSGTLNVSLQNGKRRTASVTLANIDGAFDYSVNQLWYGTQIRLLMGIVLPDGTDFYLPQGVFLLSEPQRTVDPANRQITYSLVDKWSLLDGTLSGVIPYSYQIPVDSYYFQAIQSVLNLSKRDFKTVATTPSDMIDSVTPVFTTYYSSLPSQSYRIDLPDGTTKKKTVLATQTPYEIKEDMGSTFGALFLKINSAIIGWIGYDQTGALRVDSGAEELSDASKPVLWTFTTKNSSLFSIKENDLNTDVVNDVIVVGEGLYGDSLYGRATNYDPTSSTNVNLIGLKSEKLEKPEYWNQDQCIEFAKWTLKKKTILQKSISISCNPIFHLVENRLIAIQRTDKPGSPIENHLVNSFSIPMGETGSMTINATSVQDIDIATVTSSNFSEGLAYTASGSSYGVTGIGTCTDVEINIPPYYQSGDVTSIGASAFQGNTDIKALYIPNSVTSISRYACRECTNLAVVSLPNSIQAFGNAVFYGCTNLSAISLPNSISDIITYMFYGCNKLSNISIPDGVLSIQNNAFQNCTTLSYVVIPESLTSINNNAFANCNALSRIFYKGNATQFGNITVSSTGNTLFSNATVYYYSANKPTETGNYWRYYNGIPTPWNASVQAVATLEVL